MKIWIELTNRCNLQCIHCYARSSPYEKDSYILSLIPKLIEEVSKFGCKWIQFTGGEALLLKDKLKEFISIAKSKKIDVEVYSNLTVLNEELCDFFSKNNVYIATSFYSFDEETHERITQRAGSFNRTVKNIKKILEKGINLRVGIVLTEINKKHLGKTIKFLNDLGISRSNIKVDFARPVGRWTENLGNPESESEVCGISDSCLPGKLCFSYTGFVHPCIFFRNIILGKYPENTIEEILENQRIFLRKHRREKNKEKKEVIKQLLSKRNIKEKEIFQNIFYGSRGELT